MRQHFIWREKGLKKKVKVYCAEQGIPMSDWINEKLELGAEVDGIIKSQTIVK